MTTRPRVDTLDLMLSQRMSPEEAALLVGRHVTLLPFDEFWASVPERDAPESPSGSPARALVSTYTETGSFPTLVTGNVSPGLDEAGLLSLARHVAADGRCDVLIDDVTLIADCVGDHFLVVQPDGRLVNVVFTGDSGPVEPADVNPLLVRIPVEGMPQPRVPGRSCTATPDPDGELFDLTLLDCCPSRPLADELRRLTRQPPSRIVEWMARVPVVIATGVHDLWADLATACLDAAGATTRRDPARPSR